MNQLGSYPNATGFTICALYVGESCAHKKRLDGGWYFLNDQLKLDADGGIVRNTETKIPLNFFAPNVFVHAIAGKNGSGKSSLMDIMSRMVNNFGFMLQMGMYKGRKPMTLCYIQGLNAKLYFLLDEQVGLLEANGDTMHFECGDYVKDFDFVTVHFEATEQENQESRVVDRAPVKRMAEVARYFFIPS